jgi:hemerythrin
MQAGGNAMLWTKSLETGVPKIDEQHKELFRQTDNLIDKSKADKIDGTISFLRTYVAKHFTDEEILQKVSNYPKAAFHKNLHVEFSKTVKTLFDQYQQAQNKAPVLLSINTAVINWLKEHIMQHDKEFAVYYIAKQQQGKR